MNTKRFIHFNSKVDLNDKKLASDYTNTSYQLGGKGDIVEGDPDISYQSIVYIKDTRESWTHGQFYSGSGFKIIDVSEISESKFNEIADAQKLGMDVYLQYSTSEQYPQNIFKINFLGADGYHTYPGLFEDKFAYLIVNPDSVVLQNYQIGPDAIKNSSIDITHLTQSTQQQLIHSTSHKNDFNEVDHSGIYLEKGSQNDAPGIIIVSNYNTENEAWTWYDNQGVCRVRTATGPGELGPWGIMWINGENIKDGTISANKLSKNIQDSLVDKVIVIDNIGQFNSATHDGLYVVSNTLSNYSNTPSILSVWTHSNNILQSWYDNNGVCRTRSSRDHGETWEDWEERKIPGAYITDNSITEDKLDQNIKSSLINIIGSGGESQFDSVITKGIYIVHENGSWSQSGPSILVVNTPNQTRVNQTFYQNNGCCLIRNSSDKGNTWNDWRKVNIPGEHITDASITQNKLDSDIQDKLNNSIADKIFEINHVSRDNSEIISYWDNNYSTKNIYIKFTDGLGNKYISKLSAKAAPSVQSNNKPAVLTSPFFDINGEYKYLAIAADEVIYRTHPINSGSIPPIEQDKLSTELQSFVNSTKSFLNDADASDTTINKWKEVESFLNGITDTQTLTGLLEDLDNKISDREIGIKCIQVNYYRDSSTYNLKAIESNELITLTPELFENYLSLCRSNPQKYIVVLIYNNFANESATAGSTSVIIPQHDSWNKSLTFVVNTELEKIYGIISLLNGVLTFTRSSQIWPGWSIRMNSLTEDRLVEETKNKLIQHCSDFDTCLHEGVYLVSNNLSSNHDSSTVLVVHVHQNIVLQTHYDNDGTIKTRASHDGGRTWLREWIDISKKANKEDLFEYYAEEIVPDEVVEELNKPTTETILANKLDKETFDEAHKQFNYSGYFCIDKGFRSDSSYHHTGYQPINRNYSIKLKNARGTTAIAAIAIFDINKQYLKHIPYTSQSVVDIEMSSGDFPQEAAYFICSSGIEVINTTWENSLTVEDNNSAISNIVSLGCDQFTIDKEYILLESGKIGTSVNYGRTPYLLVDHSSPVEIFTQSDTVVAPIAFYDSNKNFISGYRAGSGWIIHKVESEDIPANAVYVVFSGFLTQSPNPYYRNGYLKEQLRGTISDAIAASKKALFIDLWKNATLNYGNYNAVKDVFTFRQIELTYDEALYDYNNGIQKDFCLTDGAGYNYLGKVALHKGSTAGGRYEQNSNCFTNCPNLQVIQIHNAAYYQTSSVFNYCPKLQYIYGTVIPKGNLNSAFLQCSELREIEDLRYLNGNLFLGDSPLISSESIKTIVEKAQNDHPINITVHSDVYAKLTDANNTEWNSITIIAQNKNISFITNE